MFNWDSETRKFTLALVVLTAYIGLAVLWTSKPPQLPGDLAGNIVGALGILVGAIGNHYFKMMTDKESTENAQKLNIANGGK